MAGMREFQGVSVAQLQCPAASPREQPTVSPEKLRIWIEMTNNPADTAKAPFRRRNLIPQKHLRGSNLVALSFDSDSFCGKLPAAWNGGVKCLPRRRTEKLVFRNRTAVISRGPPTMSDRNERLKRISIDPHVCFGRPVIRGTRIWVSLVIDNLSEGVSEAELLAAYPQLKPEDIRAALAFAAEMTRERIIPIPTDPLLA
jgi:uncharacterized protein (DUF433 family)